MAVVPGRPALRALTLADLFQALGRAVALVCGAGFDEAARGLLIEVAPLGLDIRLVRAAHLGAFVPVEAQPAQAVEDAFQGALLDTGLVCVLNADDESSAGAAREQPVEQRGAHGPYMGLAGGTGREPDAYRSVGGAGILSHGPAILAPQVGPSRARSLKGMMRRALGALGGGFTVPSHT